MELYTSDSFDADLERIKADCFTERTPDDSLLIMAFLDLIVVDDDAMFCLIKLKDYYADFPKFNVSAIVMLLQRGFNIYRCRPYFKNLGKYRLIYAFDGIRDEIHMLAAVIKKPEPISEQLIDEKLYGYEKSHPITSRICADYEKLNMPKLC